MEKIAPSTQLREQLAALLTQSPDASSGREALTQLVQLATARIVQEALEQEQRDFLGRDRYERSGGVGQRNGYTPGHLDTAEGRVAVQVPQVRATPTPYRSALYDFLRGHSDVARRLADGPHDHRPITVYLKNFTITADDSSQSDL